MSINNSIPTRSNRASLVVIALIAGLLVLVSPVSQSKADYLTFTNYTTDAAITYNDRVCNLGDPSTHLTAEKAFEISTADQLWEVTDCVSNSAVVHFKITANIDVSAASYSPTSSPIGFSTSALAYSFSGVLDGGGFAVSVSMTTNAGVGLFAYLNDATFSNLRMNGSLKTTTGINSNPAGALAARSSGTLNLSSISNHASVAGREAVGGLIGRVQGIASIQGSNNAGTISAISANAGGLLGFVSADVSIYSSGNSGAVTGKESVGGLVGFLINSSGEFENSQNTGAIRGVDASGGLVGNVGADLTVTLSYNTGKVDGGTNTGGLAGFVRNSAYINNSYNTGAIAGSNTVGGLLGIVRFEDAVVVKSYNAGSVTGSSNTDGLVAFISSPEKVKTTFAYSSVASSFLAASTLSELELATTYTNWDFDHTWGFGTCSDNGGYPMLRVFGAVGSYFNASCGVNAVVSSQPEQAPAQTPAPVYSGPVISGAPSAIAGTEVTLTGNRLESVTTAHVGGVQVRIVSALAQSLILDIPSSTVPGSYDLVLQSSFGTLTIQSGLIVLAPLDKGSVGEATNKKLTVVAIKGFIAIYTKGYEGQRLSAKVAGKWLVVESLDESFKGNDYSRTVRRTGSGFSIKVHLYIDREFVRTEELVTAR